MEIAAILLIYGKQILRSIRIVKVIFWVTSISMGKILFSNTAQELLRFSSM